AILIGHDFLRRMWLISALTQRQTYIAKVLGHELIKRFDFFLVGLAIVNQLFNLRANAVIRRDAVTLESRIPLADLSPRLAGSHLHGRRWRIFSLLPSFSGGFLVVGFLFFALENTALPIVKAPSRLLFDYGFEAFFGLECDNTVGG